MDNEFSNEELIRIYQLGNESALNKILEKNQGIIHKLMRRFYFNECERDDLIQEGNIGLIYAAKKYNPDNIQKAQFITYAIYWINQKIGRYLNRNNTDDQESLDRPIGVEQDKCIKDFLACFDNIEDDVIERLYQLELKEDIRVSMAKVNTLIERETIDLLYGLNSTYPLNTVEVGEIFKCVPERVRQNQRRALSKLRRNHSLPINKYCKWKNEEQSERKYNSIGNLIYTLGCTSST